MAPEICIASIVEHDMARNVGCGDPHSCTEAVRTHPEHIGKILARTRRHGTFDSGGLLCVKQTEPPVQFVRRHHQNASPSPCELLGQSKTKAARSWSRMLLRLHRAPCLFLPGQVWDADSGPLPALIPCRRDPSPTKPKLQGGKAQNPLGVLGGFCRMFCVQTLHLAFTNLF